jgi:ribosomal protein S18 acetylase RimI-like enzyme
MMPPDMVRRAGPALERGNVAVTVRAGMPSDHLALVQIDEYAASHFDRAAAIADALAAGECLVAESGEEILGYVVLNYTFFGFGFIPVIAVAAARRRRGVGLRLLSEARSRCTSRKLFASANASNSAAQALFLRAGFERSGTIGNLDEGDPELVYFARCGQA